MPSWTHTDLVWVPCTEAPFSSVATKGELAKSVQIRVGDVVDPLTVGCRVKNFYPRQRSGVIAVWGLEVVDGTCKPTAWTPASPISFYKESSSTSMSAMYWWWIDSSFINSAQVQKSRPPAPVVHFACVRRSQDSNLLGKTEPYFRRAV